MGFEKKFKVGDKAIVKDIRTWGRFVGEVVGIIDQPGHEPEYQLMDEDNGFITGFTARELEAL